MKTTNQATFEHIISKPRLHRYSSYFALSNVQEAIGLYLWNAELTMNFSVLLGFFEVALRNSIHHAFSNFYSGSKSSSYHWYDESKFNIKPKTMLIIDKARTDSRGKLLAVSPDKIISDMTFGFWPNILSSHTLLHNPVVMPNIFKNHLLNKNKQDWKDKKSSVKAFDPIYEINDFRNRVAHYEPIWKFPAKKDTSTSPATLISPATNNLADSLHRLTRILTIYDLILNAIDSDLCLDIRASNWRKNIDFLLTPKGIARFRKLKNSTNEGAITIASLHKNFHRIVSDNQPTIVYQGNQRGLFIPI